MLKITRYWRDLQLRVKRMLEAMHNVNNDNFAKFKREQAAKKDPSSTRLDYPT